jgi:hypothetical protein
MDGAEWAGLRAMIYALGGWQHWRVHSRLGTLSASCWTTTTPSKYITATVLGILTIFEKVFDIFEFTERVKMSVGELSQDLLTFFDEKIKSSSENSKFLKTKVKICKTCLGLILSFGVWLFFVPRGPPSHPPPPSQQRAAPAREPETVLGILTIFEKVFHIFEFTERVEMSLGELSQDILTFFREKIKLSNEKSKFLREKVKISKTRLGLILPFGIWLFFVLRGRPSHPPPP